MTPGPGIARTPLPKGFTASGINCGVRRYRPDLGVGVQLQRESNIPESDQVLRHLQLHREVGQAFAIVDENSVTDT